MKTLSTLLVALGCTTLVGSSTFAAPVSTMSFDTAAQLTTSSDGGSLPGAPGGKGGARGRVGGIPSAGSTASDSTDPLYRYCAGLLDKLKRGSPLGREDAQFGLANCTEVFGTAAEPGRAGRGGDGGGFPGLPGGKGGASGAAPSTSGMAVDEELTAYCLGLLRTGQVNSDDFTPPDCANLFAGLGGTAPDPRKGGSVGPKRNGSDGPSISGGIGGRGGRAGGGPGGGRGGAGGAGIGGGTGGRGGAGGGGY